MRPSGFQPFKHFDQSCGRPNDRIGCRLKKGRCSAEGLQMINLSEFVDPHYCIRILAFELVRVE
jgi:hypothetical protein